MDLATLGGLILGAVLVIVAILLGDAGLMAFVDGPSVLIVVGGSVSAVLMRFPMRDFFTAMMAGFGRAFKDRTDDPLQVIENARELADIARKSGLIALENVDISNPLLAKGVQYCVDGMDAEFIRKMMHKDIAASIQRNQVGERVFRALGDAAPAFGMIGTLVGLVQMLVNLSDPSSIGPAMAVALLTTMYGALLGNLVFLPMADKLAHRAQQENRIRALIMDAVLGINAGTSPRVLEESLLVGLEQPGKDKAADAPTPAPA
ncbi:MAG: MotA/TolQ/ExbB proton channel family protein [Oceanococcaceae bacterium]